MVTVEFKCVTVVYFTNEIMKYTYLKISPKSL